jgi:hypothetical protein
MPGTLWSAPMQNLAQASLTTASFTTATLTDVSPGQCLIPPGALNVGTRVRLTAVGTYTATTAASTIAFGFYMASAGQAISATGAVALGVSAPATIAAITGGLWIAEYYGRMAAVSATTGTAASVVGHGEADVAVSLTAGTMGTWQMPTTLAACTVAQGATPGFGLVTYLEQNVFVGATITTNTGLTNIITDELTCELLG